MPCIQLCFFLLQPSGPLGLWASQLTLRLSRLTPGTSQLPLRNHLVLSLGIVNTMHHGCLFLGNALISVQSSHFVMNPCYYGSPTPCTTRFFIRMKVDRRGFEPMTFQPSNQGFNHYTNEVLTEKWLIFRNISLIRSLFQMSQTCRQIKLFKFSRHQSMRQLE